MRILELLKDDLAAPRDVVAELALVSRFHPIFACEWLSTFATATYALIIDRWNINDLPILFQKRPGKKSATSIAPSCTLADYGAIHLLRERTKTLTSRGGGESTAIKKCPMQLIGHAQAELGISPQNLPQVPRIAAFRIKSLEGFFSRLGGDQIVVDVIHRKLGIVEKEPPAEVATPTFQSEPIVLRSIRRGRVVDALIDASDHVNDEAVHIEQTLERRVAGSVGIEPLHFHIRSVRGEPGLRGIVQAHPRIKRPVLHRCATCIFQPDYIVVALLAAEISLSKARANALLCVVEPPVLAIDVEMVKVTARAGLPERELIGPCKFIADKVGVCIVCVVP